MGREKSEKETFLVEVKSGCAKNLAVKWDFCSVFSLYL